ncbi:8049_t:CDS:2, partial [Entrophospora sp. SA101]
MHGEASLAPHEKERKLQEIIREISFRRYYDPPPKDKIHFVNLSSKFFSNLPIFIFSFTCHQN